LFWQGQCCRPFIRSPQSLTRVRTCKVGNNSLVGASTHIYDNAQVTGSIIGQRCTIGPGVTVTNSYIFDDTVIGANTAVERSIIGNHVSIGAKSLINKGCLVGDKVVLGEGAQLRPFERVSTELTGDDDDDSDEEGDEMDETGEICLHALWTYPDDWP
jgi:translation initiation factor eIF-2B subunit epsilon